MDLKKITLERYSVDAVIVLTKRLAVLYATKAPTQKA